MKILGKQNWLNFYIVLCGFTFFYSLSAYLYERFYRSMLAATVLPAHLPWVINATVAFICALGCALFFCKPRAPGFIATAVLLGGVYNMRPLLCDAVLHLDAHVRRDGLIALYTLSPHLLLIILAVIAMYAAWLSNRPARRRP